MKVGRQSKIIELVTSYEIETQDELSEYLTEAGFQVTQATISRDIRELKLTKVSADNGHQKYMVLRTRDSEVSEKYTRVLRDGFTSLDTAENIIVIKTVSGMAMAVAAAVDALEIDGILGCIAGDDTIMCIVRTKEMVIAATEKLQHIVNNK